MGKPMRKPRPSMPRWFWWGQDGCWFCKHKNNCSQCKANRAFAKEFIARTPTRFDEIASAAPAADAGEAASAAVQESIPSPAAENDSSAQDAASAAEPVIQESGSGDNDQVS